jgi:hypothetical protein
MKRDVWRGLDTESVDIDESLDIELDNIEEV